MRRIEPSSDADGEACRCRSGGRNVGHPGVASIDATRDHRIELSVAGLSFGDEAAPLARRLERIEGVHQALLNPITERAVLEFDPKIGLERIVGLLDERQGLETANRLVRWHAPLRGGTCAQCRERLVRALSVVPGVEGVVLNPEAGTVTVEYVPSHTDTVALGRTLSTSRDARAPDLSRTEPESCT